MNLVELPLVWFTCTNIKRLAILLLDGVLVV
jgi:hypothetical protein